MMEEELLYRIALTMIPDLGPVRCKSLVEYFGSAAAVFKARKKDLSCVDGMGEASAKQLKQFSAFDEAETEMQFIEKQQIQPLFITDDRYPRRLLHCFDPPTLLYYRGTANLNHSKIISIIGSRNHTEYGRQMTDMVAAALQSQQVLIVSGLAFGIDALAHKAALQQGLETVGVLAHGLDIIYPSQHRSLARDMIACGGLLTEFRSGNKPDKHHFPRRNRIVAGMADATIVIETAIKGGSMITAELAHGYNRDVFVVPGRLTDNKSSGCLKLLQQQKALLFTSGEQLTETMGWQERKKNTIQLQRKLFVQLTSDEERIVSVLQQQPAVAIDEVFARSGLSSSAVAAAILSLELQNVIELMPGKMYRLL